VETWALIGFLAVVVLYTRRALGRVLQLNRLPAMRDCMFVPDALTVAAMVVSGVLWGLRESLGFPTGWPAWRLWLFLFFAPIWTGWCVGVVASCLIGRRQIRRRIGRQGQQAPA